MLLISPTSSLTQAAGASGSRARSLSAPGALTPPPPSKVSPAEHAAAAAAAAPARAAASTVELVKGALSRPAPISRGAETSGTSIRTAIPAGAPSRPDEAASEPIRLAPRRQAPPPTA